MIDKTLIENSFEQAAEALGDITPLVYEQFFAQYPEAEELFNIKGPQFNADLKNKMVSDALYTFMEYLDTPEEVEIVFKYTIPQHVDLNIPMKYFTGLLNAVAKVVCDTTPEQEKAATNASWGALLTKFDALVDKYSTE